MNGFQGFRAMDAFDRPGDVRVLSLTTVQRMLPLVRRVVADFLAARTEAHRLYPQETRLDREKRGLDWESRKRRYQLKEDIQRSESRMQEAAEELNELGVALLDAELGRVGFPTLVNNRPAYFSWRSGEEGLHTWHFAEEEVFRPIPQTWLKELSWASGN